MQHFKLNQKVILIEKYPIVLIKRVLIRQDFVFPLINHAVITNITDPPKQASRGVPRKRCSGNMHQIYRRTPMPKCDFSKVTLQLY